MYHNYWVINHFPVDIDVIQIIKNYYINLKVFRSPSSNDMKLFNVKNSINVNGVIYKKCYEREGDLFILKEVRVYVKNKIIKDIYYIYLSDGFYHNFYIDFEASNINPKYISVGSNLYEHRIFIKYDSNNIMDGTYVSDKDVLFYKIDPINTN
jgi:hypothetical protein